MKTLCSFGLIRHERAEQIVFSFSIHYRGGHPSSEATLRNEQIYQHQKFTVRWEQKGIRTHLGQVKMRPITSSNTPGLNNGTNILYEKNTIKSNLSAIAKKQSILLLFRSPMIPNSFLVRLKLWRENIKLARPVKQQEMKFHTSTAHTIKIRDRPIRSLTSNTQ